MTRTLLHALHEAHPKGLAGIGLALLAAMLLPVTLLLDLVAWIRWRSRAARALQVEYARCPRGHVVELIGTWTCPKCSLNGEGHAWEACGFCGTQVFAIRCACSLPVRNPLVEHLQ